MGRVNCAVIGCSNSSYQVNKWKGKICNFHDGVKRGMCGCDPPYKLYCFPSELRNSQRRQAWMKLLRREGKNKTNWKPCDSDRVCSNHFVDSTALYIPFFVCFSDAFENGLVITLEECFGYLRLKL